jgi:ribosome recycling factor
MKKIIAKYIPISQMIRKVNKSLKAWVAFIKKVQKDGVPEDDAKAAEAQVQKTTDNYIKKIDELCAAKEADLMQV